MKNLLIIYNVIFLLFGNVLFSNIHYLHNHHSNETHKIHKDYECNECIIIENSNNYFADFQEVNFSNNNINESAELYLSSFEFDINKLCSARSPPFSL